MQGQTAAEPEAEPPRLRDEPEESQRLWPRIPRGERTKGRPSKGLRTAFNSVVRHFGAATGRAGNSACAPFLDIGFSGR